MHVRLIAFTDRGAKTALLIARALKGDTCICYAPAAYCGEEGIRAWEQPVTQWAREGFREWDALVFVCAAGIAVRAIAPWVRTKTEDPAVVVVDEKGQFSIPILSGHMGGANELAVRIATAVGACPVVTTATDTNGTFAVDMFAKRNRLYLRQPKLAKEISAALLRGEMVGFASDLEPEGKLPPGLTQGKAVLGICVSARRDQKPFDRTLTLVPRRYAVGIGCRKGKTEGELRAFLLEELGRCGVQLEEVACVASVDLKREEPGLVSLCQSLRLPFDTYSAQQLNEVPGCFSGSEFVQCRTGVDCVCERAAVLAADGGVLVEKKRSRQGMTFALAKQGGGITFEFN